MIPITDVYRVFETKLFTKELINEVHEILLSFDFGRYTLENGVPHKAYGLYIESLIVESIRDRGAVPASEADNKKGIDFYLGENVYQVKSICDPISGIQGNGVFTFTTTSDPIPADNLTHVVFVQHKGIASTDEQVTQGDLPLLIYVVKREHARIQEIISRKSNKVVGYRTDVDTDDCLSFDEWREYLPKVSTV